MADNDTASAQQRTSIASCQSKRAASASQKPVKKERVWRAWPAGSLALAVGVKEKIPAAAHSAHQVVNYAEL